MADDQNTDPNVAADPNVADQANQAAQDAAAAAGTGAGDGPGSAKPHGNAGKTPWYMTEIAELRGKKRGLEQESQANAQRAADAEALLSRLQNGGQNKDGQQQHAPQQQQPAQRTDAVSPEQYQADVTREAARMNLYENSNDVRAAGFATFGAGFGETLTKLNAIGVTADDIVLDILSIDKANAHVILDKIAKDEDKAASLVRMSPRQRIVELTRMTMAENKQAGAAGAASGQNQAGISRAPPPKPAFQSSAPAAETDWMDPEKLDKMSEQEANAMFSRQWDTKYARRAGA